MTTEHNHMATHHESMAMQSIYREMALLQEAIDAETGSGTRQDHALALVRAAQRLADLEKAYLMAEVNVPESA